jgi:lipopolysaccharide biosynthesis glycosyltransferase
MDFTERAVCCSTLNDAYVPGFIVFLYTLQKHNPWFNLPYYVLTWGELSPENIKKIYSVYNNVIIQNIQNEVYEGWKSSTKWRKWGINCINRYDAFVIKDVDRVLFFDVDMIVLGDLSELFSADVEFGAVEIFPKSIEVDHPSCYNKQLKSFNGGVMSISKKYLTDETRYRLVEMAFQKTWTSDEPILNTYFTNKTTFLPHKYNLLTQALTEDNFKTARIIHFLGLKKPWEKGTYMNRYDGDVIQRAGSYITIKKLDIVYQNALKEIKDLLE